MTFQRVPDFYPRTFLFIPREIELFPPTFDFIPRTFLFFPQTHKKSASALVSDVRAGLNPLR
jgi:hypothetical protein